MPKELLKSPQERQTIYYTGNCLRCHKHEGFFTMDVCPQTGVKKRRREFFCSGTCERGASAAVWELALQIRSNARLASETLS